MDVFAWQDIYYDYTASSSCTYTLTHNGITVYTGKAYRAPDKNSIHIYLNQLWSPYLKTELPDLRDIEEATTITHNDAYGTFVLAINGTNVATYNVLNDWSYDFVPFSETMRLSEPIDRRYEIGMMVFDTNYNNGTVSTNISFAPDYNYDEEYCGSSTRDTYAIYYLNQKCGYDSYLVRGNVKKNTNATYNLMTRKVDNQTLDRETTSYLTEYEDTYEVNSGYLTTSQSKNFAKNLLRSNQMWLHNLNTGDIIPVRMDDATLPELNYKSNGNSPVNYTFNLIANNKQIKR